jgi:hypothetical protein
VVRDDVQNLPPAFVHDSLPTLQTRDMQLPIPNAGRNGVTDPPDGRMQRNGLSIRDNEDRSGENPFPEKQHALQA